MWPLFLFVTTAISKLLYKVFDGIAMRNFPPWEFTSKLSLDENSRFCSKVQFNDFDPLLV